MKKKYLGVIISAAIVAVATIGLLVFKFTSDNKGQQAKVETINIPAVEKVYINGKIEPTKMKNIYIDPTAGEISSVKVKNGQNVKKGDVLFTYKNDKLDTQIDNLELQLKSAKSQKEALLKKKSEMEKANKEAQAKMEELKKAKEAAMKANPTAKENTIPNMEGLNMQSLGGGNSISTDSIDDQISLLEGQIKNLKDARYKGVKATMDGKVIVNGKEANPQTPYMIIESNTFYVDGQVNEKDQPKLKDNQKASIDILATNKNVKGEIDNVSDIPETGLASVNPKENQNMSFYKVKIDFDSQKGLTEGFHVQATVNLDNKDIIIPKSSVLGEGENKYVYIVVDKKLKKKDVKVKDSKNKEEYILISGLEGNDEVVKNPTSDMKEGTEI